MYGDRPLLSLSALLQLRSGCSCRSCAARGETKAPDFRLEVLESRPQRAVKDQVRHEEEGD